MLLQPEWEAGVRMGGVLSRTGSKVLVKSENGKGNSASRSIKLLRDRRFGETDRGLHLRYLLVC